ncbi:unnamed protein product (macronuclear) [Paramecium tetraurelia]|uniref:Uncharacterized protein n=1 Tax=Paramecium tetraurelia TaxID=5888 RepID=A0E7D0_PARTE|nr:uncharacterized protein GSPATT00023925001 [Paramecium tetraurelia]CAK91197.1 unnamed protein product [Paramecium tetraurelia]|eukprot:XP_001458594.1 hypothetical protein (macronuclear) [Paramecium tetraurelia strain d4-2]
MIIKDESSFGKDFKELDAKNTRLRQQYQGLSEVLQFNVSNAFHHAFQDNGFY